MSHLCVVPDTLARSVAPEAEVVVHVPPAEVRLTGGTSLWLGVVSGPRSCVASSSVGYLHGQSHLPANVLGSLDDLAPLKHCSASEPSSSHPSLGTT